jgi:hypothetical protein
MGVMRPPGLSYSKQIQPFRARARRIATSVVGDVPPQGSQEVRSGRQNLDRDVRAAAQARVVGQKAITAILDGRSQMKGIRRLEVEIGSHLGRSVEGGCRQRYENHLGASKESVERCHCRCISSFQGSNPAFQARQVTDRDSVTSRQQGLHAPFDTQMKRPHLVEPVDQDAAVAVDQPPGYSFSEGFSRSPSS